MKENPLLKLPLLGQSIWMDYIRRGTIHTGELDRLIKIDGLRGITSNPSIFEKAIAGSHDYDEAIRTLSLEDKKPVEIYTNLTIEDIRDTADHFRSIYDETEGRDGLVSLEVSPHLAHDTSSTIEEARRLWKALDRPNVMIKVPATKEGLPAIQQLISEGINVNVTILFGLPRYREVIDAYLKGLEKRQENNQSNERIASVASFFLSRIDVKVDPMLEPLMQDQNQSIAERARMAHGQVAIASARAAYEIYQETIASERFRKLAMKGARSQRLLWASTSTKNPAYSDVKYVEALIGAETVNTLPRETMEAFRDHGEPASRIEDHLSDAHQILESLSKLGIQIDEITQQLEDEGVDKFIKAYDQLIDAIKEKSKSALKEPVDRQVMTLNGYQKDVEGRMAETAGNDWQSRLWSKDATLWQADSRHAAGIRNGLGWLHLPEKMVENVDEINRFVADVKAAGFQHVLHMGMGGSSLAPLVFSQVFHGLENGLPLTVLDTTDPVKIRQIERAIPLEKTMFIVASKSGTTAEPNAFNDYFYNKLRAIKGEKAGENFIVITDPDTPLVDVAKERKYRRIILNFSDVGGRYSALSYFGLVPAALTGVDIEELLERALRLQHACANCVPSNEDPALRLGVTLGELARKGRNKVTFITPEKLAPLGMWLEQLLAESTGKNGTGLLPVAGEPVGSPDLYGDDRVFVYMDIKNHNDPSLKDKIKALSDANHPVITIWLDDILDLGQEFYRWELATAYAGAVLGINAFDQPNVQESKDNTNRLLQAIRDDGHLPDKAPDLVYHELSVYGSEPSSTMSEAISSILNKARPGDYVAILAYLPESDQTTQALHTLQTTLRDALHLATTIGFGPRYLHSTGQFHKGGPKKGLFLVLTRKANEKMVVPGEPYGFEEFQLAQALGDLEALRKHGQRGVMRIDLGKDEMRGMTVLQEALHNELVAEGKNS